MASSSSEEGVSVRLEVENLKTALSSVGTWLDLGKTRGLLTVPPQREISVAFAYSSRHHHRSQVLTQTHFKYWWTLTSEHFTTADWVFLLCAQLDGLFFLRGEDLRGPFSRQKGRLDISLYTDGIRKFRFHSSPIMPADGYDRFISMDRLTQFVIEGATQEGWEIIGNMPEIFICKTDKRPEIVDAYKGMTPKPAKVSIAAKLSAYGIRPLKVQEPRQRWSHPLRPRPVLSGGKVSQSPISLLHESLNAIGLRLSALATSESVAMQYVTNYIRSQGYYYDLEVIHRFHISVKSKPLVILSGLSGSGKSKLPRLYGDALGAEVQLFPVSPAWTADTDLLGYYNPVTESYVTTGFLDFLLRAEATPNKLHICILDEMNLARVEHYFSTFLSIMEEPLSGRTLTLYGESVQIKNNIQRQVRLLDNLVFVGTVNEDESVHPFSDKVLDRANVIEFGFVDISKRFRRGRAVRWPVTTSLFNIWRNISPPELESDNRSILVELNQHLRRGWKPIGYRVADDIERWVACAAGFLDSVQALDIQIQQRILTKIRGRADDLGQVLKELEGFCRKHRLNRCLETVLEKQHKAALGYVQ